MHRLRVPLLLALAVGLVPPARPAEPPKADVFAANTALGRGINLGNALEAPQEGDWGLTLQPEYFKLVKDAGFATVRLPVRWSAHAAKDAPYAIEPKFFERVDWALDRAAEQKLNVVLNVHHYGEMDDDPDAHLPRLVGIWEQVARRYKDRPPSVVFELLNEPHGKLTEEKWNAVLPAALKAVRATNPTRPVVVGPGQWNGIWALPKLKLPDDPNLIVTVHYYDPFPFTHQGAPWVTDEKVKATTGVRWTGSGDEVRALRAKFDEAQAWAKAHNRPVFLGEFGAFQTADLESRARWTAAVAREAEARGWSWAYWEFGSGFGAYDRDAKRWRDPLLKALVPNGE
ncbi:MAG: glycoside hydrolase family 5 protein [Gemmataceae bacterium]|nr:glycoside hydrolase family 5 protein [Gemmataceae bacterium]